MKYSNKAQVRAALRGTLLFLLIAVLLSVGSMQWKTVQAKPAPVTNLPYKVYTPYVSRSSPYDLTITRIEVTQAIQDSSNSVPLVSGRNTILRIYTQGTGFSQVPSNILVNVSAKSSGVVLTASPQTFYSNVSTASSQSSYQSTINYKLPSAWLSGTLDLTVKLDADNKVDENNEANNSFALHLTFNPVPVLKVMVVPIQYTHTGDHHTYPAPNKDTISDWIMRTYPVNQVQLSWHAPLQFTGDLSTVTDFSKLLDQVTSLKTSEAKAASIDYYGLIPTQDGSYSWFHGGVAGLGWVGSRAAIGLDFSGQSSQIAAHEIGHNLSMEHTPCGGPANPDPQFPYSDGSIGKYGVDVVAGSLVAPSTKDMMTYCDPKWISDYTYKILYNNQRQYGADIIQASALDSSLNQSQRSLMVRASISPAGVNLLPAYILPVQSAEMADNNKGSYQVKILGLNGETLVDQPVRAFTAGETDMVPLENINTLIPLPNSTAAKLVLLKDGQVLAEQPLQATKPSITASEVSGVSVNPVSGGYQLSWKGSEPVIVRYVNNDASVTLGVDVSGSEMFVPSSALPEQGGTFEVIPAGTSY